MGFVAAAFELPSTAGYVVCILVYTETSYVRIYQPGLFLPPWYTLLPLANPRRVMFVPSSFRLHLCKVEGESGWSKTVSSPAFGICLRQAMTLALIPYVEAVTSTTGKG